MNTLLIVDPQNDFCDIPDAALPVSGADADMHRLASFVRSTGERFSSIVITLDSHPTVAIERTSFWATGKGEPVLPFTPVLAADVVAGRFAPRNPRLTDEVLAYLRALEGAGRYQLMIWPIHCVVGTWGHNIHVELAARIAEWETATQRVAMKVLKGSNPLTEQYSAVRAEVPRPDDPSTQTNELLIAAVRPGDGLLVVAGEASSHCVRATMLDLIETMTPRERGQVVLLRDCMSPVSGFEQAADRFFTDAQGLGVQITTSTAAAALIRSH